MEGLKSSAGRERGAGGGGGGKWVRHAKQKGAETAEIHIGSAAASRGRRACERRKHILQFNETFRSCVGFHFLSVRAWLLQWMLR